MEWKTIFLYSILAISMLKIFHFGFHSIVKFSSIFHSMLSCHRNFRLEAMQRIFCCFASEMEIGRVERPVGLPVRSRFFDQLVKPIETWVKFFLATKRHLSTNRNMHI